MSYEEIEQLVLEYGRACEEFGDYQSKSNADEAIKAEHILLNAIKKMMEDK